MSEHREKYTTTSLDEWGGAIIDVTPQTKVRRPAHPCHSDNRGRADGEIPPSSSLSTLQAQIDNLNNRIKTLESILSQWTGDS